LSTKIAHSARSSTWTTSSGGSPTRWPPGGGMSDVCGNPGWSAMSAAASPRI